MTVVRLLRPVLAAALCASVVGAGGALAAPKAAKLGPNLAPNPSFEQSVTATDLPDPLNFNPLPPTGWSYEGLTVLFDYHNGIARTGKRMMIISGALGPGKQICDGSSGTDSCNPNPAFPVTDAVESGTRSTFSVRPFVVTAAGIPVKAGATYRFSAWAAMPSLNPNAGVPGEGAATQVRWLDASGRGIAVTEAGRFVKGAKRALGFKLATADVTAPAGAAAAQLMLGHTYYTHTGQQVAFDDVSFQQVG